MKHKLIVGLICAFAVTPLHVLAAQPADTLREAFVHPPASAKPWVYWFWLNGNITREGMTADLEAMKRVGIGGVLIMEVDQGIPVGPVDFMGVQWRDLFKYMVSEAHRLGLEVNMNDDAGWNGSGGPWITPDKSMQKVVWTEVAVEGPRHFEGTLLQPETIAGFYRDITVLAFPSPGDYRIDDIEHKACYKVGFINPSVAGDIPKDMIIDRDRVADIGVNMDKDGHVAWDAPPGNWTIMRFGHTSTGVENAPAPATGRGLECDKLSKEGIESQFNGMMARLIDDVGPAAGKVLVTTHIDSWENGAQNWTERMREEFRQRRGYDLLPYLPVLSGRVVGSLEISERFLWDLRQTISDLVVENYAGHMQALARQHDLHLSIEAYGGPCDDLPYAGRADEPMGEFWVGGSALNVCKEMASAVHTYGKPILGAEAFTADSHERWQQYPGTLKPLGDQAFCLGVNRFVFHRYALQPWADRRPGMTMGPWGVHYERTETWWDMTPAWHDYLARCQFLLRQGLFVADLCYLQPEAAPQGAHDHDRNGYDYDNCGAEVVLTRMSVRDGKLVLPDGMTYQLLVLPDVPTMTPLLARRIKELVKAGATVIGRRPQQSPSLTDYPRCDAEVKQIADEVWGDCDGNAVKKHDFGHGHVYCGVTPEKVLAEGGLQPDFTSGARLNYIHRTLQGDDLYFVANPRPQDVTAVCAFRVTGKRPELWWPDTGRTELAAVYAEQDGATHLVLQLGPSDSVFVVFRGQTDTFDSAVSVACDGKHVLSASEIAPKVTVKKASYGILSDSERTRDVRDKVQQKLDAGKFSFRVAEMAAGDDPAPNVIKTLIVKYIVDDHVFTVGGDDNDTVHLTGDTAPIRVDKAIYGVLDDPRRTRDVRNKLQHLLDTGEMSFQVAQMAQGDDPAVGVVKTLKLEYTLNGERHTLSAADPEMLHLYEPPAVKQIAFIRCDGDNRLVLDARQNGHYEVTTSSGKTLKCEVKDIPAPLNLAGEWQVQFAPNWGAPEKVTFGHLMSWSDHPDPGVRHYSGIATYTETFNVPDGFTDKNRQLYLDLGKVDVMAQVTLNDADLGTLWTAPYRVEITDHVRPGDNKLKIVVANTWVNRLIGDEQLPEDSLRYENGTLQQWPGWLESGSPSPAGRYTFTTWRLWHKDDPLQSSGLIGPVTIQVSETVAL